MTSRFLNGWAAAVTLAAGLAFASTGQAAQAAKSVDPKASSIVVGDAAALGFDPAKLDVARAGLKADVASGKIAGFMVQARELAMEYQRKNRQWIYDALVVK